MPFRTVLISVLLPLSLCAQVGYFPPWGKDADLPIQHTQEAPRSIAARCARVVIHFHQDVLSPVDGPRSHFYPSSSNYMLEAIYAHGFFKGFIMGCDRLLRENGETWVYPTIQCESGLIKYDPVKK